MIENIGHYKILEELGSGGFGTVYLARDKITGVMVAIKILNPEISSSLEFRQRFFREADALRSLPTHPHIVRLLNYGDEHGVPYLVMDYLTGKDLRDVMAGSNLPVRQAMIYAVQVAQALEAAALGGLVHCDIKPENLRILHDGNVMVMDFGIARAADASFRETAGTPSYMAPELWRGEIPGPAADVYALGCVLYEMIVGTPPFQANEEDSIVWRQKMAAWHKNLEPDWRPLQMLNLPGTLIGLIKSLLAKQPTARPEIGLVRSELEEYIDSISEDVRLTANLKLVSDDRSHLIEELYPDETFVKGDEENTILHTPLELVPVPTPSSSITTTPPQRMERIGTGDQVYVQQHLASIDLGSDACRAALIYQGNLVCGNLKGELITLDLQTGRMGRYNLIARSAIASANWSMVIHAERLLLHTGGKEWFEVNPLSGQRTRSGTFPEPGLGLQIAGEWLYGIGGRKIYRWPASNPSGRYEEFNLPGRAAGPGALQGSAYYIPTSVGVVRLSAGENTLEPIGPSEPARMIVRLGGRRIAGIYPVISSDGSHNTRLRWYECSSQVKLLGEMTFSGQSIGLPQVADDWILFTFQDGRLLGCQVQDNALLERWQTRISGGRSLQAGAAYGSGLLAAVAGHAGGGILTVLHAQKGEIIHEQPLMGDFLIAPIWWERKVILVNLAGSLEVFRISV